MIEKALTELLTMGVHQADGLADLAELIPLSKIAFGMLHDSTIELPYISIALEADSPQYRSNVSSVDRPRIRFSLWHEDHSKGIEIREQIKALLDRKEFITSEARIAQVRKTNDFAIQEEDGTWQFTIDFDFMIEPRP